MTKDKYSVFIDNDKIAEHVSFEGALVPILCEKKPKEATTIIIAREPLREEAWEDKDYLIIMFGDGIEVVKGAKSLKDAICAIRGNGFLKKPLEAFDDTEVDEIVRTYNKYNEPDIKHIYVIEEKIY